MNNENIASGRRRRAGKFVEDFHGKAGKKEITSCSET
jgi:hypothetical protein